jgi:molecular chaperone DnaK
MFGIDLGTTFSVIAHIDAYHRPAVIPNAEGDLTTPSVVQFDGDERIVGKEARNSAALYPETTVQTIKRHMGSTGFAFDYQGRSYSPQEIASYILRRLAQDAAQFTGQPVEEVVITCPAYFGVAEREATAEAGKIAGLSVRSIINEPTAAAIAYGAHDTRDQTILVYDLGGGTFDVSIIHTERSNLTVIATDGDHFLGGRNWDEAVVTFLAAEWQRDHASTDDPLDSLETLEDLFLKAQAAKHTLTQRQKTDVRVMHEGQAARVTLTREKFDDLTAPLLTRTIELTHAAINAAQGKGLHQIDQILLVGGSSRMPQISARLQAEFGTTPTIHDPDHAIAKGAAIYAQKLAMDDAIRISIGTRLGLPAGNVEADAVPVDVLEAATQEVATQSGMQLDHARAIVQRKVANVASRSFGVLAYDPRTEQDVVSNLVLRNTTVPAGKSMRYGTRTANQQSVLVQIMENLRDDATVSLADSRKIGEAELILPPGLPEKAPIDVSFRLDEQGRLHIRAVDGSSGRAVTVQLATEGAVGGEGVAAAQNHSKALIVT